MQPWDLQSDTYLQLDMLPTVLHGPAIYNVSQLSFTAPGHSYVFLKRYVTISFGHLNQVIVIQTRLLWLSTKTEMECVQWLNVCNNHFVWPRDLI